MTLACLVIQTEEDILQCSQEITTEILVTLEKNSNDSQVIKVGFGIGFLLYQHHAVKSFFIVVCQIEVKRIETNLERL